jgi:hypothetical protein
MTMSSDYLYAEKISSNRTTVLFIVLAALFLLLSAWRVSIAGIDGWSILLFCLFVFSLFYIFNYRTLHIWLDEEALRLRFGIFSWYIPLHNIEACFLDTTSLQRIGGAGIHFSMLGGRYRAMLNFLEYPRVVIQLKTKKGPVRDIAFSTQRPDEVMRRLQSQGR